jgi:hypothetical protein
MQVVTGRPAVEYKQVFGPNIKMVGHNQAKFGNGVIRFLTITKDETDYCAWAGQEKGWNMANCSRELGESIIETASNYVVEFIKELEKVKIPPPTRFP